MRQVPRPRLDSALQGANESVEHRETFVFLESTFTASAVASVLSFFAVANGRSRWQAGEGGDCLSTLVVVS